MRHEKTSEGMDREYDFALIVSGVTELSQKVLDALYEAACDDSTPSLQYGQLYLEFSRSAPSLKDAIISAIHDVQRANVGAQVLRVDECDLVTASDIARRIERSRQLVHQYMTGKRGPGGFPAPECHLTDHHPLWSWCRVSAWLSENNVVRPELSWNAEVVAAINNALEAARQRKRYPALIQDLDHELQLA